MLAHARAVYEDVRLSPEEFGKRKAAGDFVNGQVPVWMQDGVQYNESLAILRFVGRQYGYYPPEYHDMWACDSITEWANDMLVKVSTIVFFEKRFDETGERDLLQVVRDMTAFMSKRLAAHGKDFAIGDKITIADFHVASILFNICGDNPDFAGGKVWTGKARAIVAENPVFNAYFERMKKQLEEHLATRPPATL